MGILVVSDITENRILIEEVLREKGLEDVVSFGSAGAAFGYLNLDRPKEHLENIELIILDITLSEINGMCAFEVIRLNKGYREIPVIMVIDYSETEKVEESLSIGVVDFITKPLNRIELFARVKFSLALKREIDEHKAREAELIDMIEKMEKLNFNCSRFRFSMA